MAGAPALPGGAAMSQRLGAEVKRPRLEAASEEALHGLRIAGLMRDRTTLTRYMECDRAPRRDPRRAEAARRLSFLFPAELR
jgi:hypothetical protein